MSARTEPAAEHVDLLILGAGLSGVGAASHLQTLCPHKTFAIPEAWRSTWMRGRSA